MTGAPSRARSARGALAILAVAAVALAVGACSRAERAPSGAQVRNLAALPHQWRLTSLEVDGEAAPLVAGEEPHVHIGYTTMRGTLGCGTFAADYEASAEGEFDPGTIGFTDGDCSEPAASQETAIRGALGRISRWSMPDTDTLVLFGHGVRFEFAATALAATTDPIPEDLPYQGTWRLTKLLVGGEERALLAGWPVTIGFAGDGMIGNATCNPFFGRAVPHGARGLGIAHFAAGNKICSPPEGDNPELAGAVSTRLMAQEAVVAAVIVGVQRWELPTANELVLTGGGGELRLARVGAPPQIPEDRS